MNQQETKDFLNYLAQLLPTFKCNEIQHPLWERELQNYSLSIAIQGAEEYAAKEYTSKNRYSPTPRDIIPFIAEAKARQRNGSKDEVDRSKREPDRVQVLMDNLGVEYVIKHINALVGKPQSSLKIFVSELVSKKGWVADYNKLMDELTEEMQSQYIRKPACQVFKDDFEEIFK